MVASRLLGAATFVAVAAGGAVLGWAGERRALRGQTSLDGDPEWAALREPVLGEPRDVRSFDGTRLYVEVLAPTAASRRRRTPATLVLMHGYGLSQHVWQYQRRALRDEFRIVAYDQRGHAGSDRAAGGDYSIGALGRDLAAVLDATVDGPAVLVGHSLGGMAILSHAGQFPEALGEKVRGAVLLGTAGSDILAGGLVTVGTAAASVVTSRATTGALRVLGRAGPPAERASSTDLSHLLTKALGASKHASPAVVAFVEQLLLDCPNDVKASLGPTLTSLDLREQAPALTVPALVLVGDSDRLTPRRQAERLVELLPDGHLAVVDGAGHSAMLEVPEVVTAHIRTHARQVTGARRGKAG